MLHLLTRRKKGNRVTVVSLKRNPDNERCQGYALISYTKH